MEERIKIINKYINISSQKLEILEKNSNQTAKLDDIIDAIVLSLSAMRWEMSRKRQITQEKEKTHSNYRLTSNTKWKKSTSYF